MNEAVLGLMKLQWTWGERVSGGRSSQIINLVLKVPIPQCKKTLFQVKVHLKFCLSRITQELWAKCTWIVKRY